MSVRLWWEVHVGAGGQPSVQEDGSLCFITNSPKSSGLKQHMVFRPQSWVLCSGCTDAVGQHWALSGGPTGKGSTLRSPRLSQDLFSCFYRTGGPFLAGCWLRAIWPFIPSEVGAREGLGQRRGMVWCKKKMRVKIAVDFFSCSLSISSMALHKTHRCAHAQEEAEAVALVPEGPEHHLPTAGAQHIPVEEGRGQRGALTNIVAIAGASFHHPFLKLTQG